MTGTDVDPGELESLADATEGVVSFSEAMRRLELILRRVETEEIDIDDLAAELRRASALLETARAKISRAELEVTQIVSRFDAEATKESDG